MSQVTKSGMKLGENNYVGYTKKSTFLIFFVQQYSKMDSNFFSHLLNTYWIDIYLTPTASQKFEIVKPIVLTQGQLRSPWLDMKI